MRRFTHVAVSLVLAVVLTPAIGAVTTSTASAAEGEFDLFALKSPGLRITSGSCRNVTVTARTNAPAWVEDVDATVDLWRGNKHAGNVWLDEDGDTRNLSGTYYFCPGLDEPGTYRLGDTEVTWWDENYDGGSFIDTSRGRMVAKQASRARFSGVREGRQRTLTAQVRYFGAGFESGWYPYPKGTKVTLQRRAASGTGSWTRVATKQVQARGRVVYTFTAPRRFQYRVIARGTSRIWNLIGPTITK